MTSGAAAGTSCPTLANIAAANGSREVPAAPYVRELGGGEVARVLGGSDISGRGDATVKQLKRRKTFHLLYTRWRDLQPRGVLRCWWDDERDRQGWASSPVHVKKTQRANMHAPRKHALAHAKHNPAPHARDKRIKKLFPGDGAGQPHKNLMHLIFQ